MTDKYAWGHSKSPCKPHIKMERGGFSCSIRGYDKEAKYFSTISMIDAYEKAHKGWEKLWQLWAEKFYK